MKKIALVITILLASLYFAQEVKLKKGIASLDGKQIYTYEREDFGVYQIHFYDLETKDEVLFFRKNDNETTFVEDDYFEIKFIQLGKGLEIKDRSSWASIVEKLIKNKVIDHQGKINEEKADLFIKNYDEKLSEKTIRIR